jgi:serine/threonine protein kinase
VYRATDTKLGRDVAVKVLPESFAADSERLARFPREAQVLASLNHPSVAAIYGVEERALIMELVKGTELWGPVSVEVAFGCARQIAAALRPQSLAPGGRKWVCGAAGRSPDRDRARREMDGVEAEDVVGRRQLSN